MGKGNKSLIVQLQNAAFKGRKEGILLGIDIAAIAINEEYGFGAERLKRLDGRVQKVLDEIQSYKDMDLLAARLAKRLMEIRKDDPDFFLEKYIKL